MIARKDAKILEIQKGTLGGDTYIVKLPDESKTEAKARCFRKLHGQEEMRCTHLAGYRTSHAGTGACVLHGGADKIPVITNAKQAVQTKKRLNGKIQEYLGKSREELLDLTEQYAATRAIFDEFIEAFPTTDEENYGMWFGRFNMLMSTMGNLVDKISRIDSRNTLTAAQVLYLRATMIDILMKYVPDPDMRERVVKEIAARMGGDMSLELQPAEVPMGNLIDSNIVN